MREFEGAAPFFEPLGCRFAEQMLVVIGVAEGLEAIDAGARALCGALLDDGDCGFDDLVEFLDQQQAGATRHGVPQQGVQEWTALGAGL